MFEYINEMDDLLYHAILYFLGVVGGYLLRLNTHVCRVSRHIEEGECRCFSVWMLSLVTKRSRW